MLVFVLEDMRIAQYSPIYDFELEYLTKEPYANDYEKFLKLNVST